jgi:hypothetical protein
LIRIEELVMLTLSEKSNLLKIFTNIIKNDIGVGPKNIYAKLFENEVHIIIQGILTKHEENLINQFGLEAKDLFALFRNKCSSLDIENLNGEWEVGKFILLDYSCDLDNDLYIYKLRFEKLDR